MPPCQLDYAYTIIDMVIKQADKGSAVMFLDFDDNKEEAYWQLNDLAVYESVESDPSSMVFPLICDKLKVWHESNFIYTKCFEYLKGLYG